MLDRLVPEIVLRILRNLDDSGAKIDAVFLGVTCRYMYSCLKAFKPGPFHIHIGVPFHGTAANYADYGRTDPDYLVRDGPRRYKHPFHPDVRRLGEWLGPEYRLREKDYQLMRYQYPERAPFLNRSIYGDFTGAKERELNERFWDYNILRDRVSLKRLLPHPGGLGEEWYAMAAKVLEDEEHWEEYTLDRNMMHKFKVQVFASEGLTAHLRKRFGCGPNGQTAWRRS